MHKDRHVKSIISTKKIPKDISIHNSVFENGVYRLSNGILFPGEDTDNHDKSLIDNIYFTRNVLSTDEYFILHRVFRSEIEYLASLNRGRPSTIGTESLKTNRTGYYLPHKTPTIQLEYAPQDVNAYSKSLFEFKRINAIEKDIDLALNFTRDRAQVTINTLNESSEVYTKYKFLILGVKEFRHHLKHESSTPLATVDSIDKLNDIIYITGWAFDLISGQLPDISMYACGVEIEIELKKIPRPDVCENYPYTEIATGFQISFHSSTSQHLILDNTLSLQFRSGSQSINLNIRLP